MSVQLDHTIIAARDKRASAEFLATILGLKVKEPFGPFLPVEVDNIVNLDFMDAEEEKISPQHYAFLVSDEDFDAIFSRILKSKIAYYADPEHKMARQINHRDGGRGFYFEEPGGHNLEILTRRYGSGGGQS
ncbi:MAG: VOC family protein [Methylocapsa sp.]|nr:VOC family protein [Methylocapsa sp.]